LPEFRISKGDGVINNEEVAVSRKVGFGMNFIDLKLFVVHNLEKLASIIGIVRQF
jgi:hypothetical protein